MDWSPSGSSVLGIFQARVLERIAITLKEYGSQKKKKKCGSQTLSFWHPLKPLLHPKSGSRSLLAPAPAVVASFYRIWPGRDRVSTLRQVSTVQTLDPPPSCPVTSGPECASLSLNVLLCKEEIKLPITEEHFRQKAKTQLKHLIRGECSPHGGVIRPFV